LENIQIICRKQKWPICRCVTRWSQLDMNSEGVLARDLVALVQPAEAAQFVTLHGADGYTTNLPLDALSMMILLIAHSVLNEPLSMEHGWPARWCLKWYAWKALNGFQELNFMQKMLSLGSARVS
jgi:DMSO/TMAO reductase YedYZ molybdopterin-dependent catalytic subunit